MLSELKKNDELKRNKLRKIYERVQEILGKCDEDLLKQLAVHFGFNLKNEIQKRIRNNIVEEHIILFAGKCIYNNDDVMYMSPLHFRTQCLSVINIEYR